MKDNYYNIIEKINGRWEVIDTADTKAEAKKLVKKYIKRKIKEISFERTNAD